MCGGMLGQPARAEGSDTEERIRLGTIFMKVRRCAHPPFSTLGENEVVFVYDHEVRRIPAERDLELGRSLAGGS